MAQAIDHVNLLVPRDGREDAIGFYSDVLGFTVENLEKFESGTKPFFSIRIGPQSVIHVRPSDRFEPPRGQSLDHFAICLDRPIDDVRSTLADADVEVLRDGDPLGATGTAPAVYVNDPFGYTVELKSCPG